MHKRYRFLALALLAALGCVACTPLPNPPRQASRCGWPVLDDPAVAARLMSGQPAGVLVNGCSGSAG